MQRTIKKNHIFFSKLGTSRTIVCQKYISFVFYKFLISILNIIRGKWWNETHEFCIGTKKLYFASKVGGVLPGIKKGVRDGTEKLLRGFFAELACLMITVKREMEWKTLLSSMMSAAVVRCSGLVVLCSLACCFFFTKQQKVQVKKSSHKTTRIANLKLSTHTHKRREAK